MTFLSPIPALIAAAVTVPLLLLFYFLKLRRHAVRVSSTLLWDRAIKDLQVNTPFRWLRFSVLLLLQLLTLAAFLLALARPAIDDPLGAGSRVIILIDRSASMGATDGLAATGTPGGATSPTSPASGRITRLEQGKKEALDLVARLTHTTGWLSMLGSQQEAAQICIAEFSSRASVRTGFTGDPASLAEAIQGISQTDQPGDLSAAVQLVQGIAAAQFDENEEARSITLFVISDGSFEPDVQRPSAGIHDIRLVQVGPKAPVALDGSGRAGAGAGGPVPRPAGSPAPPAPGAAAARDNLGITAISARRDTETPSIVRIFVRVQNAAAEPVSTTLRLSLDGQSVASKQVTVPGSGTATQTSAASPAQDASERASGAANSPGVVLPEAAVTFELDNGGGGLAVVSMARPDLLASDDSAAITLRPASKAKVLVVAPEGKPDGFLLNVLEVMDLPVLVSADPVYYEQLAAQAAAPRTPPIGTAASPSVDDWDLVIFDRYRPERLPRISSISFGAGLPIPGLSVSPVRAPGDEASPPGEGAGAGGFDGADAARFVTWRRTHALMQSVNLDGIVIAPPMNLTLPTSSSINATVLAWGRGEGAAGGAPAGGPLIALLETVGSGGGEAAARRLVIAFELVQSNWPVEDSFPPFVMNAVEFLSAKGSGLVGRAFTTAEPISLRAAPGQRELAIQGPENLTVSVPTWGVSPRGANADPADPAATRPTWIDTPIGTLPLAGVYQVTGLAAESAESFLAVNLCDGWESRLATDGTIDIPGSGSRKSAAETDARRELWQWFIAAAMLLLTVEWLVFARRIRA